ncbi:MAG: histone deacetylase [Desulfobacteraceae bacterium]|nr:histone deacetylase [Desulfobacteraceae bacterium]
MKRTGFLFDERFLLHKTGPGHPEAPGRLEAILQALEDDGLLEHLIPLSASIRKIKWIEKVHAPRHIYKFEEACMLDLGELDNPDNQLSPESYDTAVLAVGGILNTLDRLMSGEIDNAFCAVRPPGHHAEANKALGFCFFNNVAIAAKYLRLKWQVERVGIIDIDVHHGNGTQHIFEEDPNVFYYSIHEHPSFAYPGTGREFERGSGAGFGATLNSTVLPGEGDGTYKHKIERDLIPAFDDFRPEVILVSAGFDAHKEDDMADINLSTEGFAWLTERILELADRHAQGRIVSVLEGGYSLKVLPELVRNHIRMLLGA